MNIEEFLKYERNRLFILDLDDTLIPTCYLYERAVLLFQEFLLKKVGIEPIIHLLDVLKKEGEIDYENRKKFGYSLERFPTSLVETFTDVCDSVKVSYTEKDKKLVYGIGKMAFKFTPKLCEGAEELLILLKKRGDTLYLWTVGPYELQMDKINKNNLERFRFFNKIFPVRDKTKQDLEKMVENSSVDRSKACVVGDNYGKEVDLGIELGLFAVRFHVYDRKPEEKVLYVPNAKEFLNYLKSL